MITLGLMVLALFIVATFLIVVILVVPPTDPRVAPSDNYQHYSAYATHEPGAKVFSLYPDIIKSMRLSENEARTDGTKIEFDAPEKQGIYDVSWAMGYRNAALSVNADPRNAKSRIIVVVPDFTWQAYNKVGGRNLYSEDASFVSLERPLGQLLSSDIIKNFARKYAPFIPMRRIPGYHEPAYNPIKFLENNFFAPDVVAQSALHEYHNLYDLSEYDLIVLYGHDEYWSTEIRERIESAVSQGTSLLNLSGNTCWWHVNVADKRIQRGQNWFERHNAEEALIGVSFRFAGYPISRSAGGAMNSDLANRMLEANFPSGIAPDEMLRLSNGFRVLDASDRIYKGTGLADGDWFGVDTSVNHIETDGWPLGAEGNELGVKPLPLAEGWTERGGVVRHSAPIVRHSFGEGAVISFGTIGWVRSLLLDDPAVRIMTVNAVNELLHAGSVKGNR